jgi:methyl-accepting chemotaxis protein
MRLTILHRILLVAAIPLVAFLSAEVFMIRNLLQEQAVVHEMDANIPAFAAASVLIDRLQKERGCTAMWLSGKADAAMLQELKTATDGAWQDFAPHLSTIILKNFLAVDSIRSLDADLRQARERFSTPNRPELRNDAIATYSELIAKLSLLQGAIVNARTAKGLGKVLSGLMILENAKEHAGILRALGASILARDTALSEEDFQRVLALKAEVDSSLKSPALVLTPASRQKLKTLPESSHWQEVERILQQIILHASRGGFSVPAMAYFEAMSHKIADMQAIVATELQAAQSRLHDIDTSAHRTLWTNIFLAGGITILSICLSLYLAVAIVRRIRTVNQAVANIAEGEGNLSMRLPEGHDELGRLSRDFNRFMNTMAQLVDAVRKVSVQLDDTATSTSARAQQMDASAGETSSRTNTVAASAEEMSVNTVSVATHMQNATANLGTVAAAAEEMSATIQEVATQTGQARTISQEAALQVSEVQRILKELVSAAQEIGSVSEAIAGISSQTNLLALNATIEAARAGEAGRGFAVVANEIKELANQTAKATDQIRQRIDGVQGATQSVDNAVDRFAQVFQQVGGIVESIAAVIKEQATAMREMAENIATASSMVSESGNLAGKNAHVASSITQEIAKVNEATAQMAQISRETLLSATNLAQLATELNALVGRFRLE